MKLQKDMEKATQHPNACKDEQGRLRVAAASTIGDKGYERAMMLIDAGVLNQPLLYLSLFFKQPRSRYYELLDGVRQQGD